MSAMATWLHAGLVAPKRLRRLVRLPSYRRQLVIEALFALMAARALMLLRRFEHVAGRLGRPISAGTEDCIVPIGPEAEQVAKDISWAIRWVARIVPFRSVCLQQAVAARIMLRRRKIQSTLYFGVLRTTENGTVGLKAHAWLRAGLVEVTGYDLASEYREIARYE